jgi:hypothetical protein
MSGNKRRELLESLFTEGTLALDPQAEFDLRHENLRHRTSASSKD